MKNLLFIPLSVDAQRSADLVPNLLLDEIYKAGLQELRGAIRINIRNINNNQPVITRELSSRIAAAEKWFGSERFLGNILTALHYRNPDLPQLSEVDREMLDLVPDTTNRPSWVWHSRSITLQKYDLIARNNFNRLESRFDRVKTTLPGYTDVIVGNFGQASFIDWVTYNFNNPLVNCHLTEDVFRRVHSVLYQQTRNEFANRGPFGSFHRDWSFSDEMSRDYTAPRATNRYQEALESRRQSIGLPPLDIEDDSEESNPRTTNTATTISDELYWSTNEGASTRDPEDDPNEESTPSVTVTNESGGESSYWMRNEHGAAYRVPIDAPATHVQYQQAYEAHLRNTRGEVAREEVQSEEVQARARRQAESEEVQSEEDRRVEYEAMGHLEEVNHIQARTRREVEYTAFTEAFDSLAHRRSEQAVGRMTDREIIADAHAALSQTYELLDRRTTTREALREAYGGNFPPSPYRDDLDET